MVESASINEAIDIYHIDQRVSTSIEDIEKINLAKFGVLFKTYFFELYYLLAKQVDGVFCTLAVNRPAFLRDLTFVLIAMLLRRKTILKLDGLGVSNAWIQLASAIFGLRYVSGFVTPHFIR